MNYNHLKVNQINKRNGIVHNIHRLLIELNQLILPSEISINHAKDPFNMHR